MYEENQIELKALNNSANPTAISPFWKTFFVANVAVLATTSTLGAKTIPFESEKGIVEYVDGTAASKYPIINFQISDGRAINLAQNVEVSQVNSSNIGESTLDVTFKQIIGDLRRENTMLRNRISHSFPTHTVIYMIGSSCIGIMSAMLICLRFIYDVYTIDPYYLICTLIICLTLFFTALVSIKDWKDFLNEK